jgi:uncharacterized membrane protein
MFALFPLLLACTHGAGVDTDDTAGAESTDSADPCAGVPTLDWDNFGHGFLLQNCQGCHASTAVDRHYAPDDVTFDTVEQAWAHKDAILRAAAGDDPTMPPRGGVSDDDRTRLGWWLNCGTPGT